MRMKGQVRYKTVSGGPIDFFRSEEIGSQVYTLETVLLAKRAPICTDSTVKNGATGVD